MGAAERYTEAMSPHGHRIVAFLLLFVVVIWGGLTYLGAHTSASAPAGKLALAHTLSGRTHWYTGSIPAGCEDLSAEVESRGMDPAHLTISLALNPSSTSCGKGVSLRNFSLSYESAGKSAPVLDAVTMNGATASFFMAEK